jgi:hypothetical protein
MKFIDRRRDAREKTLPSEAHRSASVNLTPEN